MAEGFNTEAMLDMYLFENQQLLEKLQETVLEQKDEDCFDEDAINEIFRTMQTIKGSSGVMMFDDITAVSHKLEDIFYVLRESHPDNVPHLKLVEHVLEVADFITNGNRRPQQECITDKQYEIISKCWCQNPKDRLTISDVVVLLDTQIMMKNLSNFFDN